MAYEMLVLDLDGTLTNSEKKITPITKAALRKVQELGKHIVLASGRPTYGIMPLAEELELAKYGGYVLSFNGARIINCRTNEVVYDKHVLPEYIPPIHKYVSNTGANLVTYTDTEIISAFTPAEETYMESFITKMEVKQVDDFVSFVDYPINKMLITGKAELLAQMETELKATYHSSLSIYRSEPYFLEVMPQNIDKAKSLQRLLSSLNMTANEMICCGDGFNDITMIEYAGLGVAMANAQTPVLDIANYVTKSNNEDGIAHVIEEFML